MELIASSRGGVKVIVMVWFHGEYYCLLLLPVRVVLLKRNADMIRK